MIRSRTLAGSLLRHGLAMGLILGTMFWIALAEDKSWGILMGIAAILVTKWVYVTVPGQLEDEGEETPD